MKEFMLVLSFGLLATPALADPAPQRTAYFGETHMHMALSLDACIGALG
jgi:hypothetical protein